MNTIQPKFFIIALLLGAMACVGLAACTGNPDPVIPDEANYSSYLIGKWQGVTAKSTDQENAFEMSITDKYVIFSPDGTFVGGSTKDTKVSNGTWYIHEGSIFFIPEGESNTEGETELDGYSIIELTTTSGTLKGLYGSKVLATIKKIQ